jgi:ABC-type multidrug transport system fused ATPase/permease subunit
MANGLQLFEPYFVSRAFNAVQFSPSSEAVLYQVIHNLIFIVLITLGFWALHGTSRVIEMRNSFLVRKNYRQDMFDKVLALPTDWHKNHHSGDTIDKISKASEGLYSFSSLVFVIVMNSVRLFGGLIALYFYDKTATVLAFIIAMTTFAVITKFDDVIRVGYWKIFKAENSLAAAIHDYISNIITIITLRLKSRVSTEIDRRGMLGFPAFKRNTVLGETKWFFSSFLLSIMITSVLILNAYHSYYASGVIVVGTLFAIYQYLRRIGDTFFDFAQRYSEFVRYDASVRAAEVLTAEYEKLVHKENSYLPSDWQEIEIKKLNFTYEKDDSKQLYHLKNINLKLKRNSRIAFIGESGSGKSTLLSLLRGLYQVSAQVYCDGKKLPQGLEHLHEHITLIPQDPEIFNSTVEDNITMETKVSPNDLEKAISLAQFKSVVKRLPQGLQTNVLEKGVSLSGGEKQRLALARGVLAARNSEFLFMDEPTSSVDTQNELAIYTNVMQRFEDKTIISSIHRLHLLRMFDSIYYFKNGQVEASGTLAEISDHPDVKELLEKYALSSGQTI